MNDFKIGDECWLFYTSYGRSAWDDCTIVDPKHLELTKGTIVDIEPNHDNVYIYIKGEKDLVSISFIYFEDWVFKSKNSAIDAMIERVRGIKTDE